ncbi:MAG: hypothetical protein Kow0075_01630 [Salibacteraceae bacterium]
MPQSVIRKCAECGEPLRGRADQKFCSDHCRNAYHNRRNSDANNLMRNINNQLRKNRRVLDKLNPGEKTKVNKAKLQAAGFDFNYFTHIYETKTGSRYFFCYEMGYLVLNDDEILIVRREGS